jgi:hypothetical protein
MIGRATRTPRKKDRRFGNQACLRLPQRYQKNAVTRMAIWSGSDGNVIEQVKEVVMKQSPATRSWKLPNTCKRFFRALTEFLRDRTEFSFSGNESDGDALRLGRQAHEFDAVVEGVIEHVRG